MDEMLQKLNIRVEEIERVIKALVTAELDRIDEVELELDFNEIERRTKGEFVKLL